MKKTLFIDKRKEKKSASLEEILKREGFEFTSPGNREEVINRKRGEPYSFDGIISTNPKMAKLFNHAVRIAESHSSAVLITGEIGTGKKLLARAIHYHSQGKEKPFVAVHCYDENKGMETDLFNINTTNKNPSRGTGHLELAEEGTIFFDEIANLRLKAQQKILQVIEEKQMRGPAEKKALDTRIVAATSQNLEEAVRKGDFIKELYYRLNIIPLHIPPLRERTEDIPALATSFIREYSRDMKRNIIGLSDEALEILKNHTWPGNVKELKNIIERAVLLKKEGMIEAEDLPSDIKKNHSEEIFFPGQRALTLEEMEKYYIESVLKKYRGNKSRTAKALNITRQRLKRKLNHNGLRNKI
jgi:DNA-binding NtrC family response regulator